MAETRDQERVAGAGPKKIALFDMDGTLCDYTGRMLEDLERVRSPEEERIGEIPHPAPPWLERRMEVIRSVPGWWRGLPRLEDGFAIFDMVVEIGFRPHIATKGPVRPSLAWDEKVVWCRENIDAAGHSRSPIDITVTLDKSLLYGRVLVEDWVPYVKKWLAWRKRGLVVLLDRAYNRKFEHPQVVRYRAGEEGVVRERLVGAYERE